MDSVWEEAEEVGGPGRALGSERTAVSGLEPVREVAVDYP